jgi:hypothetical protein
MSKFERTSGKCFAHLDTLTLHKHGSIVQLDLIHALLNSKFERLSSK